MSRGLRILFALFTGGYIGSVVALDIHRSFWFECVGMCVGAMLTWIICDYKGIVAAAPVAWQSATNWRWQPDRAYWREYFQAAGTLATWFLLGSTFLVLLVYSEPSNFQYSSAGFHSPSLVSECRSMLAFSSFMFLVIAGYIPLALNRKVRKMLGDAPGPFTVFFGTIPPILMGGWLVIKNTPAGARTLGRFVKHLFLLTYSDEKLLFSVSAAFGAGIGYHFGHALVGGLIAVVLSIPNFEIVSVLWLKLVPTEQSLFRHR